MNGWLMLLHQIPPKPPYFRAKVLRRLTKVGALAIKNSAYLLPDSEDTREDFEWICREITAQGGAAWLFRVETLAGLTNEQIKTMFTNLRSADYQQLIRDARALLEQESEPAEFDPNGGAYTLLLSLSGSGYPRHPDVVKFHCLLS